MSLGSGAAVGGGPDGRTSASKNPTACLCIGRGSGIGCMMAFAGSLNVLPGSRRSCVCRLRARTGAASSANVAGPSVVQMGLIPFIPNFVLVGAYLWFAAKFGSGYQKTTYQEVNQIATQVS